MVPATAQQSYPCLREPKRPGIDSKQPLADIERQPSEAGRWVRAVRDLYLELLGRDPIPNDRAGLRSWYKADPAYIRDRLMQSAEYLARRGP